MRLSLTRLISICSVTIFLILSGCDTTSSTISAGGTPSRVIATARPTSGSTYFAAVPGFGCDHGGGRWSTPGPNITCQSHSLHMLVTSALVDFLGAPQFPALPNNYRVSVDVTESGLFGAGFIVRNHHTASNTEGYIMAVDDWGAWFAFGGKIDQAMQSQTPLSQPFHLVVEVVGPKLSFTINGTHIATFTDATYPTGDSVSLYADSGTSRRQGTADFSNFSFTALP